jgi:hypothetical protein
LAGALDYGEVMTPANIKRIAELVEEKEHMILRERVKVDFCIL